MSCRVVMDVNLIKEVTSYKGRGAKFYFRRNHLGCYRIKVKHGPFQFFTKCFETDFETYEKVKNLCGSSAFKRSSSNA